MSVLAILTGVHAMVNGGGIDQISAAQRTRDALVEISHFPATFDRRRPRYRKHFAPVLLVLVLVCWWFCPLLIANVFPVRE